MTSTRSLYKGACFPLYELSLNKDVVAPTLVIQSHVVGMASPYKYHSLYLYCLTIRKIESGDWKISTSRGMDLQYYLSLRSR